MWIQLPLIPKTETVAKNEQCAAEKNAGVVLRMDADSEDV